MAAVVFDKLSKANGNDLVGKITQIILGEASEDEIQVFDPGRVNADYGGTYGGPFAAKFTRSCGTHAGGRYVWPLRGHLVLGSAGRPLSLPMGCLNPQGTSIDPRWDPLMNVIVTYAHPSTDAVIWETVINAHGRRAPHLRADARGWGCPLTKSGMTWWGAKDQIKNVTSGALTGQAKARATSTTAAASEETVLEALEATGMAAVVMAVNAAAKMLRTRIHPLPPKNLFT
ncbi:hypothetical protein B0H13DRAFT_1877754 [Mycena leptocephala]|nr:hypothetical protein B0H13DRAFT_1877754 [Mycena leptocephala]